MILTKDILDNLVEQAKENPRLRQNLDMRTQSTCPDAGYEDASQRMLNAIEPGGIVPVHRYPLSSETVTVLRGAVRQSLFEVVENSLKLVEQFVV